MDAPLAADLGIDLAGQADRALGAHPVSPAFLKPGIEQGFGRGVEAAGEGKPHGRFDGRHVHVLVSFVRGRYQAGWVWLQPLAPLRPRPFCRSPVAVKASSLAKQPVQPRLWLSRSVSALKPSWRKRISVLLPTARSKTVIRVVSWPLSHFQVKDRRDGSSRVWNWPPTIMSLPSGRCITML